MSSLCSRREAVLQDLCGTRQPFHCLSLSTHHFLSMSLHKCFWVLQNTRSLIATAITELAQPTQRVMMEFHNAGYEHGFRVHATDSRGSLCSHCANNVF